MATLDEKRKTLVDLLGGDESLADGLLKQVSEKEAQATGEGVTFKAKKKAPMKDDEALEEVEGEAEAVSDSEGVEEEADADEEDAGEADEDEFEGDEEDDEDMDEEEKEYDGGFLGDVPSNVFYSRLADALSTVLTPFIEEVKELRETVTVTLKERKSETENIAALKEKLATQDKELSSLKKTVKGLQADVPRGARQFLASQEDDTVITEQRAKELGAPVPDPLSDFTQFALGKQQ